jgi:hypothetical protein
MLSLQEALKIAKEREGYERCFCEAHGLGTSVTYNGKTAVARFAICPIVQFYPKPTFLFHSVEDFLLSSEKVYRERGWI